MIYDVNTFLQDFFTISCQVFTLISDKNICKLTIVNWVWGFFVGRCECFIISLWLLWCPKSPGSLLIHFSSWCLKYIYIAMKMSLYNRVGFTKIITQQTYWLTTPSIAMYSIFLGRTIEKILKIWTSKNLVELQCNY
jgi:hypothetical protein